MENEKNIGQQAEGYGDESLNSASVGSAEAAVSESQNSEGNTGGIHNNALYAASMGRAATAQVDPHSTSGLAQTGTNISYEGPTAAGSGGSAGSGYTSGQAGTDTSIQTDSDYDQAGIGDNKTGE